MFGCKDYLDEGKDHIIWYYIDSINISMLILKLDFWHTNLR